MKTGNVLADFEWQRAVGGYRWQRVRQGLLMVPAVGDINSARMVTYRPFSKENAGLFKEFASLDLTPDAALSFANKYGQLGYPLTMQVIPKFGLSQVDPEETENTGGPRYFRWPTGEFYALTSERWSEASWEGQRLSLAIALDKGDEVQRYFQQHWIGDALRDMVRLFPWWSEADQRFELRFKPVSLIGAIWLQAFSRAKDYRLCLVCQKPIEISRTGGARTDARFCSNKCRTANSRQRQAEARAMHSAGKTAAVIAKKLKTSVEIVRRWVL